MSLLMLRALLFAGECFAASLLLPVLAFAATALMRRAALRHLVWMTLFGVLAVLPVAALLLPARRIVEHVTAPVVAVAAAPVAAPVTPTLFTMENLVLALAAIWLGGLIWQMLRLCTGGLGLMRLRRASVPFAAPIDCAVRLAGDESGPSTFGILRPVVLLPRSAAGWTPVRLEAVLRHEAAHVARRDTLSLFVARLVCALYWLNPLLWLGLRSLRRQAEIAADDAVLASGMTPSLYAAELVALAAEGRGIAPGIAMARLPLTQRVQAVLAENSSRKGVSRMDIAKTVCFGLTATLLLGAARFDIAVAQDAPVPVAPVAAASPAPPVTDAERAMEAQTKAAAAQAERVKARADRVTAQAKARADTEKDPVKAAQYRSEAAKVAADAAQVKAQADRAAAQYADEARKHMALAFQLADEVRQKNTEARQRADEAMRNAAADRLAAEAAAVRAESVTIDGHTFAGNVELKQGKPGGPVIIAADRVIADLPQDNDISQNKVMSRFSSTKNGVHIDAQVASADFVVLNRPEVAAAVTDAMRAAIAEASKKIDAAVAEAKAKTGLPPVAPIPPAPPPPAPVPPPPYAPN